MTELPVSNFELQAGEERRRLQASLEELKGRVYETFDVEQQVRRHALLLSSVAALAAATLGYGFAGLFSRR